jgi:hypothetical protein
MSLKVMTKKYMFSLFLILFINTLLRLPSLFEPAYSDDEHFFLTIGRSVANGSVLYKDVSDITLVRPPLIFWMTAIFDSQFSFRLAALAATNVSILFLFKIVTIITSHLSHASIGALMLALLISSPILEGNIPYNELFVLPLSLASAFFMLRFLMTDAGYQRHNGAWLMVASGLSGGLAFLIRIHAFFDFLPILLTFIVYARQMLLGKTYHRYRLLLILGYCIPIVIAFSSLFMQGVTLSSLNQLVRSGLEFSQGAHDAAFSPEIVEPPIFKVTLLGMIILAFIYQAKRVKPLMFFVALWTVSSTISSLLLNIIGLHYTIQVVAPIILFVLAVILERDRPSFHIYSVPILLIVSAHFVFSSHYHHRSIAQYYKNYINFVNNRITPEQYNSFFSPYVNRNNMMAEYLSLKVEPLEHIFVWGINAEIYSLTETLPSSKYIWHEHVEYFNAYGQTISSLDAYKPKYIITFDEYPLDGEYPILNYISEHYILHNSFSAMVEGNYSYSHIYERKI